jgi:hypothetical protein
MQATANKNSDDAMTDGPFIATLLQKGNDAKQKATLAFSNISLPQLNWKSSPQSWSIAQCLDHLITSNTAYFPDLKKITEGTYKMNLWEKHSPFTKTWGRLFTKHLQEQVKRKMKAPKFLQPAESEMAIDIIDRYHQSLDTFLQYISLCRNVDVDRIIITSPIVWIVTYSLRDAFTFLLQHEHRHLNQAIRVKSNENFPKD